MEVRTSRRLLGLLAPVGYLVYRGWRGASAHDAGKGAAAAEPGAPAPLCFDLAVEIGRPPEDVYAVLSDVQLYVETVPASGTVRMTKSPAGPTRIGTRWHERVRVTPGYWMAVDSVATEVDPPGLLGMDFRSGWFTGHLTYTIEPVAGGSRLRQQERLRLHPPLRTFARSVDAMLRPRLVARLEDIRRLVEGRGSASTLVT
ncbi:MAG TPA: SRPBCC family protein [Nocardioidaceae bacterium]|jgi:uncharacterized protein YndB with AHSA1/START domain